ncbi:MAG: hypothetical protein UT14_C0058G0008 [Candidatus Shapirobacteria bacterium GW2011_GWE1_38_92]|uniref:Uncharacterized protein n=2 Tax=Candidatus Shapironibacteriota TaxID=1752721 RepID=A0A0G0MWS7_9BACT|nr:MAG: hypothetical protein US90_C0017G0005 [Candidatus Shapirobacteria bacterium GW2011_GWE2_38_30]KKQ89445.1 MAG: hypothetical protein UT14_C0058G0008 [Candidatus Shapirobacteria bacterium GW2011_GWE1_38_92]
MTAHPTGDPRTCQIENCAGCSFQALCRSKSLARPAANLKLVAKEISQRDFELTNLSGSGNDGNSLS